MDHQEIRASLIRLLAGWMVERRENGLEPDGCMWWAEHAGREYRRWWSEDAPSGVDAHDAVMVAPWADAVMTAIRAQAVASDVADRYRDEHPEP